MCVGLHTSLSVCVCVGGVGVGAGVGICGCEFGLNAEDRTQGFVHPGHTLYSSALSTQHCFYKI